MKSYQKIIVGCVALVLLLGVVYAVTPSTETKIRLSVEKQEHLHYEAKGLRNKRRNMGFRVEESFKPQLKINVTKNIISTPFMDFGLSDLLEKDSLIYKKAGDQYNVPWQLISSIHAKETSGTRHTKSPTSPAGAYGCTQFLPSTFYGNIRWVQNGKKQKYSFKEEATEEMVKEQLLRIGVPNARFYKGYGVDGSNDGKIELENCVDAIYSTANYLSASGDDYVNAVYRYNKPAWYLKGVRKYAKELNFIF
jgi:hypothetical protein